uniref:Gamma-interferon-inducible protein 16 n=2 Tax=Sus scrofa TaxID=9823 RepID=A0A8D1CQG4_PIG
MGNEFKRIVLLKGFQHMDDYHFKMIKSLLAHDLRLTRKMQEEYDRIKIADLMEERFRGAACVDKLIELVKGIDDIKHLVKPLQKEKLKVLRRLNAKETASAKKRKQNESSTDESTSATNEASGSESTKNTPMKKNKTTETNESKRRKLTQEESQLPGTSRQLLESATSTQSTESLFQTLQTPAPTPSRISSTKEKKDTTTKANDFKKKVSHKQSQLPGTSAASACPTQSSYQMMQMCLPAPSTSSSVKEEEKKCMFLLKKEGTTTKTVDSSRMKRPPVQSQHPQLSTYSMYSTEACLQMPQMLSPTPASSPLAKISSLPSNSKCSPDTQKWCRPLGRQEKPRLKVVPKEASKEDGFHSGPKEVMVLKAMQPFTYDVRDGERKMFHATVATENQFFQVKVFHVALKEKFIPKKIIAISDYYGRNGFLELYSASSVSEVNTDRKMEISKSLIQKANATPKISDLYLQTLGTFVSGVYLVHKKLVCNECLYYEIQDKTGVMEVLVYGRLTSVYCEEGDKLRLTCFELALSGEKRQLRSVIHSFIKVRTSGGPLPIF